MFLSSRRRHTRSKRDWSSDVCSSDLAALEAHDREVERRTRVHAQMAESVASLSSERRSRIQALEDGRTQVEVAREIGRASCSERGEGGAGAGSVKGEEELGRGVREAQ